MRTLALAILFSFPAVGQEAVVWPPRDASVESGGVVPLPFWSFAAGARGACTVLLPGADEHRSWIHPGARSACPEFVLETLGYRDALELLPRPGGFEIRGEAAKAKAVFGVLEAAWGLGACKVAVRAVVIKRKGRRLPPVLDASETKELFADGASIWRGDIEMLSSYAGSLNGTDPSAPVGATDDVVVHGLNVQAHRLAETSNLALFVQFAFSQRGEDRIHRTAGLFSGTVPDGGALTCTISSGAEPITCIVSARAPSPSRLPAGVWAGPVSLLHQPSLDLDLATAPWGEHGRPPRERRRRTVDEILIESVTPAAWFDTAHFRVEAGSLLVIGGPEQVAGARQVVVGAQAAVTRTVMLDVQIDEDHSIQMPMLTDRIHPFVLRTEDEDGELVDERRAVVRAAHRGEGLWSLAFDSRRRAAGEDAVEQSVRGEVYEGQPLRPEAAVADRLVLTPWKATAPGEGKARK